MTRNLLEQVDQGRRCAINGTGRDARVRIGLARSDLGHDVGVDSSTVWRWENGKSVPRGAIAIRYLHAVERMQRLAAARSPQGDSRAAYARVPTELQDAVRA